MPLLIALAVYVAARAVLPAVGVIGRAVREELAWQAWKVRERRITRRYERNGYRSGK